MVNAIGGPTGPRKSKRPRESKRWYWHNCFEDGRAPGSKKIPTLSDFSSRFFPWLDALPADRPPKEPTRKYYRTGWKLLQKTNMAGRRLDHITRTTSLRSLSAARQPTLTTLFALFGAC